MENLLDIIDAMAHEKGVTTEQIEGALKIALVKTAEKQSTKIINMRRLLIKKRKLPLLCKLLRSLLMTMSD